MESTSARQILRTLFDGLAITAYVVFVMMWISASGSSRWLLTPCCIPAAYLVSRLEIASARPTWWRAVGLMMILSLWAYDDSLPSAARIFPAGLLGVGCVFALFGLLELLGRSIAWLHVRYESQCDMDR